MREAYYYYYFDSRLSGKYCTAYYDFQQRCMYLMNIFRIDVENSAIG